MKILYVGTERSEAQAISAAMSGIAGNVAVSYTSRLDQVVKWIDENSDRGVLVVEAQLNGVGWRSALTYAAGSRATVPIVVIVPEAGALQLESLHLPPYDRIVRNQYLLRDLPPLVMRTLDRAREGQHLPRAPR